MPRKPVPTEPAESRAPSCGVIYIATGAKYADEAAASLATLRRHELDLPATLFTDVPGARGAFTSVVRVEDPKSHPRKVFHAKVAYTAHTPYERTLFLDTDTHVCGTLREVFAVLDRFEVAGVHAPNRVPGRHKGIPQYVPDTFAQLNSGVLLYRKSRRTSAFLADWLRRYHEHDFPHFFGDQQELREALWDSDIQLGVLSTEWNCRFQFGVAVQGPVKILHGRHPDMDLVERRINERPRRVRTFVNADFDPVVLRAWAARRSV